MIILKLFFDRIKLLTQGTFLILLVTVLSACLFTNEKTNKEHIIKIGIDGEESVTIIDFGSTVIGSFENKTLKLTNLSNLDSNITFHLPQGFERVTVSSAQGNSCNDRTVMFVKGGEVCYFGIQFKPQDRYTYESPLDITVSLDEEEHNYKNILTLKGVATNSESVEFSDQVNFGLTAKNSSKIKSSTLINSSKQNIYYNITLPDSITIDPMSQCDQSGEVAEESSCEVLFRYSAGTRTGDITDIITLEQDSGTTTVTATMSVKSSAIVNIVAPTSRYDASMITSGDSSSNGKLKLIGGKNDTNTANDIWTFDISKEIWTLDNKAFIGSPNIAQLYNNRVATVNNKTLVLPNPVTTGESFDDRTFTLNVNNTLTPVSNISNTRNNYKIATNTTTKQVYIYGGKSQDNSLSNDISLVLDNGGFSNITATEKPDRYLAAFSSANNKFYLFGGKSLDNSTTMSKSLYEYDNQAEKWQDIEPNSQGSHIIFPNNSAEMVSLKNISPALYIFGGKFENDVSEDSQSALYKFELESKIWSQLTDNIMPPVKTGHNLVQFGERYIYLFGGLNSDNQPTNDLWVFDTTIGKWEKINLPLLEHKLNNHAVTASKDGRYIYIYGGQAGVGATSTKSTKFMVYDTELDYFKELASIGTSSDVYRFGHQLVYAKDGNAILLLGGSETLGGVPVDKHYQYDIEEDTWTELQGTAIADLKIADHTAVNKDGTIYIIGGKSSDGNVSNRVVTITFADNETTTQPVVTNINNPLSLMSTARYKHSATVVDNHIYVAGGRTSTNGTTNSVEKFNLNTLRWSDGTAVTTGDFNEGFRDSSLVADGTTLYLIGGVTDRGNSKKDIYKSVSDGAWQLVATGAGNELDGEVEFQIGKTYFIKANNAFINFGGDVLSIIYP